MTIEEKTIELQSVSPPLTTPEIIAELGKWQAAQSLEEDNSPTNPGRSATFKEEKEEVIKTPEVNDEEIINEEEEGNQEVVAEEQDATVTTTPDNASETEDTESPSEDGSSESQEPEEEEESYEVIRKRFFDTVQKQKNETGRRKAIDTAVKDAYKDVNPDVDIVGSGEEVVDGDFTYRYESEVDDEGNLDLQVFYKGKDDEEFINASERAKSNPKNVALQNQEAAIQSQLGFLPAEVKEQANQQLQTKGQVVKPPVQMSGEEFGNHLLQLKSKEKQALLAGRTEEEALASYNEMLEEYDMAGFLDSAQVYSVEDAKRKKELEKQRDALPQGQLTPKIDKELKALEEKYSISNILYTLSDQKFIDQQLENLAPDILTQATEDAQLIPFNLETGLGYKDGEFILKGKRVFTGQKATTAPGQRGDFMAAGYQTSYVESSEKLNEQADLYRKAKVAYAKRNKVPLKSVTNLQVKEDVIELYRVKLTEEAQFKIYEDRAEQSEKIEGTEKFDAGNTNIVSSALRFFGFKNFDDVFGDTDQEKFSNLNAAYRKYLDGKKQRIVTQSLLDRKRIEVGRNIALSKTYETQEEIDEVNAYLDNLNIQSRANFKIFNKTLDEIAEEATTAKDAELFANLQSKNYGAFTNFVAPLISSTASIVSGVVEGAERYGILDAYYNSYDFSEYNEWKNTSNQLKGEKTKTIGEERTGGKIVADFTGNYADLITNFIDNEISIPKSWDDTEGGMDVARYLARATGEQIPIYMTLAYTGGAGLPLIGLSTAGNKFREMQKEIDLGIKDYSILQMYTAATINGASAALTEYATQGILGRLKVAYGANTGIKKGIKEGFKDIGARLVNWSSDQAEEIPSELLDTFINNFVDKEVLGDTSVNLFDGFKDTAISTLWTSGIVMRAPLMGQQIIAPFRSKQSFQTIGENTAIINKLQEIVKDPSTSARAKQKAAGQVNQLIVENMKALKVDIDRLDQFKPGERKTLMDLKAQQYEVLRGIDATLADGTLNDSQKELEIKLANTQLGKLQTQSAKIIAPYIIAENKAKNEPIIDEAIKNVEQVTKKVLGESINVIDDMNNLPEGVPKFVDAYVDPKTNQIYINKEWAASVGAVTAAEHELLHKIQKSLFDTNPAKALELVEDFKKTLGKRERRLIEERLDANYRFKMNDDGSFVLDENGNKQKKEEIEYAEEYFNIFSDLVGKKEIGFTDNLGENLLRFVNKLKELVYKPAGFKNLEYQSGRDAYNFIKDYNKSIKEGKVSERAEALIRKGTTTTSDRTSPSITTRGQEFINLSKEGVYDNESLVEIVNSPSSNQTDRFAAMEAIVETNWPVISKGLKFNPTGSIPMDAVKTAVTEQMQGIFPGRNKELLADFNAETAQVNTYLGSLMRQRQAEILERAKQIGGTLQEGTSIDSEAAKQVVDTTTRKTTTKRSRTPKAPTETVKYSDTIIEKAGVKDKGELETKITEATTESFKDVEVDRFGQTKDVPPAVAKIYGDMLGLNPETISDKTRTYQNYDEAGLNAAQRFLLANAASDYARLPKTKDETTTRGRGTFIPKNMKDALYTDGKLTGTLKDYMDLLRSKPTGKLYRDSKYAQLIRGLLNTHIRNRMFETLVDTTPKRLRGGAKFSITAKNIFQAAFGESQEIGVNAFNFNWNKELNKFFKDNDVKDADGKPIKAIDMSTEKGRERFLKIAETPVNGVMPIQKIPAQFWISLGFVSQNALTSETLDGLNLDKQEKQTIFSAEDKLGDLREFSGNLPFKNSTEARIWIGKMKEKHGKDVFPKPSENFKAMIKQEDPFTKKGNLANELNSKEFQKRQEQSIQGLKDIFKIFQNDIMRSKDGKLNPEGVAFVGALLSSSSAGTGHFLRKSAPMTFYQKGYMDAGTSDTTIEHTMPATLVGKYLFMQAVDGNIDKNFKSIKDNYFQGPLLKRDDNKLKGRTRTKNKLDFNYIAKMPDGWQVSDSVWARYFNTNVAKNDGGIDPNSIVLKNNQTVFDKFNITSSGLIVNNNTKKNMPKTVALNNATGPASLQPQLSVTSTQQQIYDKSVLDAALAEGRKINKPVKKIRVFDFDDTLARSKSKVIATLPVSSLDSDMLDIIARRKFKKQFENKPSFQQNFKNLTQEQKNQVIAEMPGAVRELTATEFAAQAASLESQGATFNFDQFEQVIDGKKGPLFDVAKKIADTRGTEDLFILTARPQEAAGPIKAFMKALGVDIPLGNITGLGDGTAAAKGRWIAGKAAEGYNDFYFADDASKNVKAVKEVLDQIDVKSRVQQAKFSKTKTFDTIVNQMIEDSSGIESFKQFSAAKAKTVGKNKGRFDWLTMASSAEDFKGLLYSLLGNGKKGEAQYEFLKTNLIDPYNKAEDSITQAKIAAANDFMALKEQFPGLPKTLETETGVGKFTYQHALRTYMWTQQGMSIPGLSKADARKLNKFITDDAKLQAFADQLMSIQKGKPYPKPGKDWLGGNLTTDIIGGINDVNRKEYQQEFRENVDIIFSPENLNKMEAAYGTRWRKALENTLTRMKAGTNRLGYNDQTSAVLDWVNNSVGAVMFLNTRSALLQTISAVNFINWGDNNIIAAGKAFANQKQFWGDFMTLMNSDYLTQRRNGLKINVSESEIADAVKDSKNKVKAAIAFLLSKGFVLTRYADSFAIASGGATFYRNRMNKYVKEGMSQELAREKAFQDFRLVAEESQQSSSPDKISMQQASAAGRVILNWANTPMQYVRIQKRSIQDLIAGRGDAKTHISRIAYYGVVQNLIFNALQQALFAIGFGDDDDDEEKSAAKKKQDDKKIARVANGMIDSQLKGLGIAGAGMVAVKNTLMKIYEESGKNRSEYEKAAIEALSFSPAISSKYRKIVGGLKSFSWNMKEIKQKGFSLDNPAYLAGAQIITAATNIPIDRVIKKANNIRGIMSEQSQMWQKVSMALGWSSYDVGLPYYGGWDKPVEPTPAERKKQEIKAMKLDTNTAEQTQMLLDLGLDKKQIKALRYEDARVKKIIELQNKNKKDE